MVYYDEKMQNTRKEEIIRITKRKEELEKLIRSYEEKPSLHIKLDGEYQYLESLRSWKKSLENYTKRIKNLKQQIRYHEGR